MSNGRSHSHNGASTSERVSEPFFSDATYGPAGQKHRHTHTAKLSRMFHATLVRRTRRIMESAARVASVQKHSEKFTLK